MKLTGKILINGTITAMTGLHIGGNKSSLEIGGVDLNIIKTGNGIPFIPGSSLKGKLLSLLARLEGSIKKERDPEALKNLFGYSGGKESGIISRIQVRDAILNRSKFDKESFPSKKDFLDFDYSEVKSENTIDRGNSKANPRQVERVPAGAEFILDMVLDLYDEEKADGYLTMLGNAFGLLHWDYLGGHGTRGSGKVAISITSIRHIEISKNGIAEKTDATEKSRLLKLITPPVAS